MFDPTLVHEWLERNTARQPQKEALICGDERWTYAALNDTADRLADALIAAGLRRHDRAIIYLDNCPAAVIALYAVLKAGGVFVLINDSVKAAKLAYIQRNSGARFLITHVNKGTAVAEALVGADDCRVVWIGDEAKIPAALAGVSLGWERIIDEAQRVPAGVRPARPRVIDADLATLIYTSGSTGEPKGVMSSHQCMLAAARAIVTYLGNKPDDIVMNVLPLSFDYGLYQVIMAFIYGGTIVLEKLFLYVHPLLERIGRERVTGFPIVPTIVAMLLRMERLAGYDFSSLRYMTNTGAALPVEHIRRLREIFPHIRIFSMFGLTECKRVCYLPPEELDRRPASVGVPMPGCEVFVVDENGREVAPGETGQLVIRGANVMLGYWGDPELTARAYHADPTTGERVLYSGDYFRRDADGFLYFLGRRDDMIKSRGERVSAREVENHLCEIPGVVEAAVIGVPDEILGQAIKAFVALAPGSALTEREILRECTARMESFMAPKQIVIINSLPKTANGKVDKKALRQAESAPANSATESKGASA